MMAALPPPNEADPRLGSEHLDRLRRLEYNGAMKRFN